MNIEITVPAKGLEMGAMLTTTGQTRARTEVTLFVGDVMIYVEVPMRSPEAVLGALNNLRGDLDHAIAGIHMRLDEREDLRRRLAREIDATD